MNAFGAIILATMVLMIFTSCYKDELNVAELLPNLYAEGYERSGMIELMDTEMFDFQNTVFEHRQYFHFNASEYTDMQFGYFLRSQDLQDGTEHDLYGIGNDESEFRNGPVQLGDEYCYDVRVVLNEGEIISPFNYYEALQQ